MNIKSFKHLDWKVFLFFLPSLNTLTFKQNDFFEQGDDVFEQNFEDSFYDDQDMGELVTITNCCDENLHFEEVLTSELDYARLAPPLERQVSVSLGPHVEHLSDAFDLVRKFEFQAPWISDIGWSEKDDISPIQIDEILFDEQSDVVSTSENNDVSFF